MKALSTSQLEALEALVDATSLRDVLSALSDLCYVKGDHVRDFWQDTPLSLIWRRAATYLDRVSNAKSIAEVPR